MKEANHSCLNIVYYDQIFDEYNIQYKVQTKRVFSAYCL